MDKLDNGVIMFQLTAARRRLHTQRTLCAVQLVFQLTAARRRLPHAARTHSPRHAFQLTAARRRLRQLHQRRHDTRQRFNSQPPEGGCNASRTPTRNNLCFNSQPPEGGCEPSARTLRMRCKFQLTAARRRLHFHHLPRGFLALVSTHSRPKAAAPRPYSVLPSVHRFNSQPPEGGCWTGQTNVVGLPASFQLTAARRRLPLRMYCTIGKDGFQLTAARRRLRLRRVLAKGVSFCFNSQPPEGGCVSPLGSSAHTLSFQLTAARRRLLSAFCHWYQRQDCFNSQPPEGGCTASRRLLSSVARFNSQPPEGGCFFIILFRFDMGSFNSQPPEGGCVPKEQGDGGKSGFNSQPPEGGCSVIAWHGRQMTVSTHSRPKAAARGMESTDFSGLFQLTAARRRLRWRVCFCRTCALFQLTAARRRLPVLRGCRHAAGSVSTHSRPKAAAMSVTGYSPRGLFQLTAARRRLHTAEPPP